MADLATLQARLAEAELAYHALLTGTKEVSVQQGSANADFRVTYTETKAADLASYIDSLKAQIAAEGGTVAGSKRRALEVDL